MRGGGIKKESSYVLLERRSPAEVQLATRECRVPGAKVGASDEAHGADGAPTTRDQQ